MTPQTFTMSVLLHRDGNAWVAQGLEYDLAAQAPTEELAKERFLRTFTDQIVLDMSEGREPLSGLPPAPPRYFAQSTRAVGAGPDLPVYVPVMKDRPRVTAQARFLQAGQEVHAQ